MPEDERQQLQEVIAQNLDSAEKSCQAAHTLLPPAANVWQPTFLLALVALERGQMKVAADMFLEGHAVAQRAGEHGSYAGFLGQRQELRRDVRALCRFAGFSRIFVALCR